MNYDSKNKLHTELCSECLTNKRTGLTMAQYDNWKQYIGRRSALERSIKTLTDSHDFGLLHDRVCYKCANKADITISCDGVEFMGDWV
jgi:hypothetical protein